MNSPLLKFFTISITNILTGGGSGVLTGWCMTEYADDREYQLVLAVGMWGIGASFGLILGWIAYYIIYRQKVTYEIVCFVVTITSLVTAASAYGLSLLIGELGWITVYIVPLIFLFAALFTWDRQRRSLPDRS